MSSVKQQPSFPLTLPKANLKRILCTSTLTQESSKALDYAVLLARSYGAKLFCLHSVETPLDNYHKQFAEIENRFTQSIATYLNPVDPPILDWEILLEEGLAADKIVETAKKENIDLIVMLSRRRPLGAALLGSTAEKVCQSAPCSVLVIHPEENSWTDEESGRVEISRILVGCDFSEYSKLAFAYALELANTFGSEIDLVQVLPVDIHNSWSPVLGNPIHQSMSRMEAIIPKTSDTKFNRFVAEGEPYQEILKHMEERNVDLICIGSHGKESKQEYLFGTTTDKILRAAKCPVLVSRYY
ncbi:MAG: universal stress protein [Acidobacteria bacterium]|nr:universal stress protein [Acidobacteriota bacterium]